jgi:hypothetical protein
MTRLRGVLPVRFRKSAMEARIVSDDGLEKRTCECYAVVRHEYERLLPQPVHR